MAEAEKPAFKFENLTSDVVIFERLTTIYWRMNKFWYFTVNTPATVVLRNLTMNGEIPVYKGEGGGKVFIEDVVGKNFYFTNQKVWARQLNPEQHTTMIVNDSSDLWVLGLKTENWGTVCETKNGGRTEILGGLLYPAKPNAAPPPGFIVTDSSLSVTIGTSDHCPDGTYKVILRESRDGETRELSAEAADVGGREGEVYPLIAAFPDKDADPIAPTAPSDLKAATITETQIKLDWTAASDNVSVTGYIVYRNGQNIGTIKETTFTDTDLVPNTAYTYWVKAKDAAYNESLPSNEIKITTLADTQAPDAPGKLRVSNQTETSATLEWDAAADNVGTTEYAIYRDGTKVGSSTGTSYRDAGLTVGSTYAYSVQAKDGAGNVSAVSSILNVTIVPDIQAPTQPSGLKASWQNETSLLLTWNASEDNSGVTEYGIYRDTVKIGSSEITSYNDTNLTAGVPYRYQIIAKDGAGNSSEASNELRTSLTSDVWFSKNAFGPGTYKLGDGNTALEQIIEYDVIPLAKGVDALVGYADTSINISDFSKLSMAVRANLNSKFDVRNGGAFGSITSVPYVPNNRYHIKIAANLGTKMYSVWITPEGGSEIQIAKDYAFRTDAPSMDDLGQVCLKSEGDNKIRIENHVVHSGAGPVPTATPTPSLTATPTPTPTVTPTPTPSPTATPSPLPTPIPGSDNNVALNKTVTFSGQSTGSEASKAVDGDSVTRWSAYPCPQWLTVDLGAVYNLNKTELLPYQNRAYKYKIEVSGDGIQYTPLVDKTGNTIGGAVIADSFDAVSARYVKLTVIGCHGYTGGWASIHEFRVLEASALPTPTPTLTHTPSPTPTPAPTPIDGVKPVTTVISSDVTGEGTFNNKAVSFSFNAVDNEGGSGVKKTEYRVNRGIWTLATDTVTITADGAYQLEYRSEDFAGNVEETRQLTFGIDTTPPVIQMTDSFNVSQTERLHVSAAVYDSLSGVKEYEIKLDGVIMANPIEKAPLELSLGEHKILVSAIDSAGNRAQKEVTLSVAMDLEHLDELMTLGYQKGFISDQVIYRSLLAHVNLIQKKQSKPVVVLAGLRVLSFEIRALSGKKIDKIFADLLQQDISYLQRIYKDKLTDRDQGKDHPESLEELLKCMKDLQGEERRDLDQMLKDIRNMILSELRDVEPFK